jgi:hypothetical protein
MTNMTNGCKWAVGAAVSIWLAMAGSVQARVFILDDAYNPGEQVAVEFKGCPGTEAQLEKLLPLLKQRQTTATSIAAVAAPVAVAPSVRIAMASPVRATRFSLPLMVGVGY